ncbi:MAG TPA: enolase C-terminal domain-like protein [Acidimicrobiales bacterium]|nr:enolase C-terminal domain-like protein [Acidimicrobiales bacterium]
MVDVPAVDELHSCAYRVPTDRPEGDGTLTWDATTVVVVTVRAGDTTGTGWTYGSAGCRTVIESDLVNVVVGTNPLDVTGTNGSMVRAIRNLGRPGVVSSAIAAVDTALWDLKARLLDLPLAVLFGRYRSQVAIYGSGGFTTYDDITTVRQLEGWVADWGANAVKIKIGESWGSEPERDMHRVGLARDAVGTDVDLLVDANGAYGRKQAVRIGQRLVEEHGVSWFEEPLSSDDLEGLRHVRQQCSIDVAAGEYGYDLPYFDRMIAAEAVDCVQVDVTRCGGYTEWLRVANLARARSLDVSGHCAPNLHAHVAGAVPNLRHVEYFHDHYRIESLLFDGSLQPRHGALWPEDTPGHGLVLKASDAEQYVLR